MEMSLKPPSLEPKQYPTLGELFLIKISMEATYGWEPVPSNSIPPIVTRYGLCVHEPNADGSVQVQLSCAVMPNESADEQPTYTGELLVGADVYFNPAVDIDTDTRMKAAAWFSLSILVGETRSHIRMITSLGPNPPIVVSEVNVRRAIASAIRSNGTKTENGSMEYVPLYPEFVAEQKAENPRPEKNKRPSRKKKN